MADIESSANTDWLSARLRTTPQKAFLHVEAETYSFADMDRLARATAAFIKGRAHVGAGDHVALFMRNGPASVLSLLALMRLGAVIVPLNTRLTAEELEWQIKNSGCTLLICERDGEAIARAVADAVLVFPGLANLAAADDADAPDAPRDIDLNRDFAIIHTSGTSGRPKAAILTYNNIFQSALGSAFRLGLLPDDHWLCILPTYHVGGLSIILRSLIYGTAVELSPMKRFDVDAVNRLLTERPISLISLVPTMLSRLLDAKKGPWNPRFRLVLLGGEATPVELVSRCLAERIPIAPSYGLSEAASQVATAAPDLMVAKPQSVGKPLLFTELRVLDERGDNAAPGKPGEIIVKGPQVMRGYYNDSAATERSLRAGWLYTGDIGSLDHDGDLVVLQRREDLILSGGENIYPAEVEKALREHPAIEEAVAVGLEDAKWGQRVAAAIQLRDGRDLSEDAIFAFARSMLASYKIPREIRFISAFPRTSSGKIQRREVRKLFND
ncbi:MAG: o-succinylbenzoate--CoA ligase [Chloroflexi bacterium]|nr:o-succinylbenzoate--CoA ligase [Chloroflexota bacterium]